jgi:Spy/CpxP family protein refolding chaperone
MMRKRTIGACLIVALAAGGYGVAVLAAPVAGLLSEDGGGPRPWKMFISGQIGRLMSLRSELQLTTEQREQIREILKSHRQELVTVVRPIVEKRRALREATRAKDADERAIRAAADDLGKAIGDAAVVGAKIKAKVMQVMTTDQREKIEEFREQADAAVDRFIEQMASTS